MGELAFRWMGWEKWTAWQLHWGFCGCETVLLRYRQGRERISLGSFMVLEVLVHVNRPCCTGPEGALDRTSGVQAEKIVYIVVTRKGVGGAGSQFPLQGHTSSNPISSL